MITEIVDQAIALGRPVFPVRLCKDACLKCDICKAPACPHGFHDATKDLDRIRQIFQRFPGQLIGTPTGEISGFDVLDIDTSRHPEAVNWWLSHRKYISKTRAHQTGSSGLHLLFQHSPRARWQRQTGAGHRCQGERRLCCLVAVVRSQARARFTNQRMARLVDCKVARFFGAVAKKSDL